MIKVLVVDDEKDVEFLFNQQFRKEIRAGKIKLYFAFSGEEAISFMKTLHPFDLVLLMSDINMPGMTGLELLRITKEKFPGLKVVFITACDDSRNRMLAEEGGAAAFLSKPLNFEELKKSLFNPNRNGS